MRQITRLSIAILCLLLLSSACVFAAASTTTTQFKLYHSVGNPSKTYYCEFWDPNTNQAIRSITFEEGGRYVFATVMVIYNTTINRANITITFDPLKGTGSTPNTFYYDYTLEVLKPNTNDTLAGSSITYVTDGHGQGSAVLASNKKFTKTGSSICTDEVADLAITLNQGDSAAGTYTGNITITLTT